jgi:hypothetical protein
MVAYEAGTLFFIGAVVMVAIAIAAIIALIRMK